MHVGKQQQARINSVICTCSQIMTASYGRSLVPCSWTFLPLKVSCSFSSLLTIKKNSFYLDYKDKSPQNLASSWPSCHISLGVCVLSHFSHVQLSETLWTVARQAPLSMGFSRQEYWSGLPCPPPGSPPDPEIEPASPVSPALQAASLALSHHVHKAVLFPHPLCLWVSQGLWSLLGLFFLAFFKN